MKKLFVFPLLALSVILFSCGSPEDKKQDDGIMPVVDTSKGVSAAMAQDSTRGNLAYICPCGGCPEIRELKPGKCSKCEMDLVAEKK